MEHSNLTPTFILVRLSGPGTLTSHRSFTLQTGGHGDTNNTGDTSTIIYFLFPLKEKSRTSWCLVWGRVWGG